VAKKYMALTTSPVVMEHETLATDTTRAHTAKHEVVVEVAHRHHRQHSCMTQPLRLHLRTNRAPMKISL
jgi:hypothetical protein